MQRLARRSLSSWPDAASRDRQERPLAGYGRRTAIVNGLAAWLALSMRGVAAQERRRLLVLGDSLTAGYGLPKTQAFPARLHAALRAQDIDVDVIDAGVSGDTSAGGLARLDWALGDPPPGYAIVELGANDGLRGLPPATMEQNLDAILTRLKARGVRALLAGMRAPPNLGRDYVGEYEAVFPRLARKHEAVFYPFFLEGIATDAALNQGDGLHPNAAGVEEIVRRILPSVRRLLGVA
jgi:acyl-CoA thioesterase-1